MSAPVSSEAAALLRRGLLLEYLTITWSVLSAFVATDSVSANADHGNGTTL